MVLCLVLYNTSGIVFSVTQYVRSCVYCYTILPVLCLVLHSMSGLVFYCYTILPVLCLVLHSTVRSCFVLYSTSGCV